jgi:hypothetical protein
MRPSVSRGERSTVCVEVSIPVGFIRWLRLCRWCLDVLLLSGVVDCGKASYLHPSRCDRRVTRAKWAVASSAFARLASAIKASITPSVPMQHTQTLCNHTKGPPFPARSDNRVNHAKWAVASSAFARLASAIKASVTPPVPMPDLRPRIAAVLDKLRLVMDSGMLHSKPPGIYISELDSFCPCIAAVLEKLRCVIHVASLTTTGDVPSRPGFTKGAC